MDRPQIFKSLNDAARNGDVFSELRKYPLDVVADAMLEIPADYPDARAALPKMASDAVQDKWTGNHGHTLLFQSCAFVRSLENGFLKYAGRSLDETKVLDYGCGWGRLLRLMYRFTAPENIYGCDPLDESISICRESGINANLEICDFVPKEVPFRGIKFDLIYAFSVFTHLSEKTAQAVLAACRRSIADDGLLAVTIRPESYWYVHSAPADLDLMRALHRADEYAFTPHNESRSGFKMRDNDGVITYGDASFSLEYVRNRWSDWELVGTDISLLDPYQTVVFLKPRPLKQTR